jgi:AmiR/NasT family two-component response regulator
MAAQPVAPPLSERCLAAHQHAEQILEQLAETQARLRDTRKLLREGRDRRAVLHDSAYARLAARLDTLPVVEQAKGILVAQTGCTPDEAFELLRSASQRSNVKLRDVARKIVEGAAADGSHRPRPGPRPK